MSQLRYEYPEELAPDGQKPIDFLRELVNEGSAWRYPGGVPEKVRHAIRHELSLIEELNYEAYFLTVWDLVRKHLKDERLRQAFSMQPLLVGGNPFQTTSIYNLIHFLEREWGIILP